MNAIQKTALKETAKTIAGITGIVFVVSAAIALLSLEAISTILLVYCLGMGTKMIYDIKLTQAKVDAEFNKTVDQ